MSQSGISLHEVEAPEESQISSLRLKWFSVFFGFVVVCGIGLALTSQIADGPAVSNLKNIPSWSQFDHPNIEFDSIKRLSNLENFLYATSLDEPTKRPTRAPKKEPPTKSPFIKPSISPTIKSVSPVSGNQQSTNSPSRKPSLVPTKSLSVNPSKTPTRRPTTLSPSNIPYTTPLTSKPSARPTMSPSRSPTTPSPSRSPSSKPLSIPTPIPTPQPVLKPTAKPLSASSTQTSAAHFPGAGQLIVMINGYRTASAALTRVADSSPLAKANLWISSDMAVNAYTDGSTDSLQRSLFTRLDSFGVSTTTTPPPVELYYYGENCIDFVFVYWTGKTESNNILKNTAYKNIAVTISAKGSTDANVNFVATFSP